MRVIGQHLLSLARDPLGGAGVMLVILATNASEICAWRIPQEARDASTSVLATQLVT